MGVGEVRYKTGYALGCIALVYSYHFLYVMDTHATTQNMQHSDISRHTERKVRYVFSIFTTKIYILFMNLDEVD